MQVKKFTKKLNSMKMIIIGGSAGSFEMILSILNGLDKQVKMPIVIILHRLKNSRTILENYLQVKSHYIVKEAEDKELMQEGYIYTAAADYHLLLNENLSFSLDVSDKIHFSRPSIDVSFESFSLVLKENCCGILLSGANKDGAQGLKIIAEGGGDTLVQDCSEAAYKIMPQAAIDLYNGHDVCKVVSIIKKINNYAK
jgi:two-component system chemotaxis response regulator CheB